MIIKGCSSSLLDRNLRRPLRRHPRRPVPARRARHRRVRQSVGGRGPRLRLCVRRRGSPGARVPSPRHRVHTAGAADGLVSFASGRRRTNACVRPWRATGTAGLAPDRRPQRARHARRSGRRPPSSGHRRAHRAVRRWTGL